MEQKVVTRRKIVKVVVWIVIILALMWTAHTLVNHTNLIEIMKTIHGG
jgi:hypothetical protein